MQEKAEWKRQVIYKKIRPPWLKGNIVFVYGVNQSSSIIFQEGTLLRKSDLKSCGKKILGSNILAEWMFRDYETSLALR